MPYRLPQPAVNEFLRNLIRHKIRRLASIDRCVRQHAEDLEQEAWLAVLRTNRELLQQPQHHLALLTAVLDNCLADFLRYQHAAKRDDRRVCSLHTRAVQPDGTMVEFGQRLSEQVHHRRLRVEGRTELETTALVIDVQTVMRTLPRRQRVLAELLLQNPVAEAARLLGQPRSTVQARILKLRRLFARAGLEDYLGRGRLRTAPLSVRVRRTKSTRRFVRSPRACVVKK